MKRRTRTTIAAVVAVLAWPDGAHTHDTWEHVELAGLACNIAETPPVLNIPSDDPPRSRVIDGSWDEDDDDGWLHPRNINHGFNPLTETSPGLFFLGQNAPLYAETLWSQMVSAFRAGHWHEGDGVGGMHYLGRVSHLLQDMSSPPHVCPQDVIISHSNYESYWRDLGVNSAGIPYTGDALTVSSLPWEATSKLDQFTAVRLQARHAETYGAYGESVQGYLRVMAWTTYFRVTFWGEVEFVDDTWGDSDGTATQPYTRQATFDNGTVPGSTYSNTLHTMFGAGNVRYINSWGDDYFEITDRNGYGHKWMTNGIDDWWPCANPSGGTSRDGSVTIPEGSDPVDEGVRTVGRFYFKAPALWSGLVYLPLVEDWVPIPWSWTGVHPQKHPDGTSMTEHLGYYYGWWLFPLTTRYNAGLIGLANRPLTVTSSPGSTYVQLSQADNLGNSGGTTGSSGFDRYFVSGESLTLTADATDSSGQAFEAWLRNGGHYSSSRSIMIAVSDEVEYTAVYVLDADGDGYSPPEDCDDNNYYVHPGATEYCNGIDDDCDDQTDEQDAAGCTTYYRDSDNDGYGVRTDEQCLCSPTGVYRATEGGDCDDGNASVYPGATEYCNGFDDDCDEQTDEENASGCSTYHRDSDNDGFGVNNDTRCLCSASGVYTATQAGDCNDSNPNVYPGATELCSDQIDNDCDQQADCADASCDSDPFCQDCGDGPCQPELGENPCTCSADCGTPPATEQPGTTCADGSDNDCDGLIDGADPDCSDCGNDICEQELEEDGCSCSADCGSPPATEVPGTTCADGIDNDCDDLTDCADPDCACDGGTVCSAASGGCCEANGSPGCEDESCCATVCACDPFCCENEWDADCAIRNTIVPGCDAATLCDGRCGVFHPADLHQSWSGDCSCATCNDWRIEECEARAYAEAWQRGEHDDMTGAVRALYVWMTGECYHWSELEDEWLLRSCEP